MQEYSKRNAQYVIQDIRDDQVNGTKFQVQNSQKFIPISQVAGFPFYKMNKIIVGANWKENPARLEIILLFKAKVGANF